MAGSIEREVTPRLEALEREVAELKALVARLVGEIEEQEEGNEGEA